MQSSYQRSQQLMTAFASPTWGGTPSKPVSSLIVEHKTSFRRRGRLGSLGPFMRCSGERRKLEVYPRDRGMSFFGRSRQGSKGTRTGWFHFRRNSHLKPVLTRERGNLHARFFTHHNREHPRRFGLTATTPLRCRHVPDTRYEGLPIVDADGSENVYYSDFRPAVATPARSGDKW